MKIDGLEEYSTNFELVDLKAFLEKISGIITSGFGQKEINIIMRGVESLNAGDSYEQEFKPVFNDKCMKLVISVYMSDYDAPDVYIFTPPELNDAIDKVERKG